MDGPGRGEAAGGSELIGPGRAVGWAAHARAWLAERARCGADAGPAEGPGGVPAAPKYDPGVLRSFHAVWCRRLVLDAWLETGRLTRAERLGGAVHPGVRAGTLPAEMSFPAVLAAELFDALLVAHPERADRMEFAEEHQREQLWESPLPDPWVDDPAPRWHADEYLADPRGGRPAVRAAVVLRRPDWAAAVWLSFLDAAVVVHDREGPGTRLPYEEPDAVGRLESSLERAGWPVRLG